MLRNPTHIRDRVLIRVQQPPSGIDVRCRHYAHEILEDVESYVLKLVSCYVDVVRLEATHELA